MKAYVAALRRRTAIEGGVATIGHGELDERDRVLLSIAERAGAVELSARRLERAARAADR